MIAAEDPVTAAITTGQIPSCFSPSLPWKTPVLAFGGHECAVAARGSCVAEWGGLSLSHRSAGALHSHLPETSSYNEGLRREKEKPKSKHGFCSAISWALGAHGAPTVGMAGSWRAAGVCELPFAGLKKHARRDLFLRRWSHDVFSSLEILESFLQWSCALLPPFWGTVLAVWKYLWPSSQIIYFSMVFPTVHY